MRTPRGPSTGARARGPYALVVGAGSTDPVIDEVLAGIGAVKRCPGAGLGACPALKDKPCSLRDGASLSVIHIGRNGGTLNTFCMSASDSPAVGVLADSTLPAAGEGDFALIGAISPPEDIVATVASLVPGLV